MFQVLKQAADRLFPRVDGRSLGILALVGAACLVAYALYPHPREQARKEGVQEIIFWTHMDPNIFDPMKPAIEEFEKRNPQYRVRMGTATARDVTADPTRFLLGVAGGVPPDLIYFDQFAVVQWASRGAFTDLTPFLDGDRGRPDGVKGENFYKVSWNEPIYKGKSYAIPNNAATRAMYFNHDPFIRAGLVYDDNAPEVREGEAEPGEPRPPQTWEELCHKILHAEARAEGDGTVVITGFPRRPSVNTALPEKPSLSVADYGVRPHDVVALITGSDVFRGRIKEVAPDGNAAAFRIDLVEEQPPGRDSLPIRFHGACEVKVFDQDGYQPKLTHYDPETGRMTSTGLIPMFGNSWLYMYAWLNGASFMSEDGAECRLDSPEIVEALQWVVDCYDAIGGVEAANVFQAGASTTGLDPFISGAVAMRIDTSGLTMAIMAYRPALAYGVTPPPIPRARLEAGHKSLGWVGGWSYAIPSTAKQKEGAWELLRWLASMEANQIITEAHASIFRARGQPFFPFTHPDKRVQRWLRETYVDNNSSLSEYMVEDYHTFESLMPGSKHRPITPVGQLLWSEQVRAMNTAMAHQKAPYESLNYGKRRVQSTLDRVLHPPDGPEVNWYIVVALYVLALVALMAGLVWAQRRTRRLTGRQRRGWMDGYIAASPWLFGFIVFGGGPILFSLIISFCHYDVLSPARFIGWQNYIELVGTHYDEIVGGRVANDPLFWKSLANTTFMALSVPLGIVVGLAIALLLDTNVRGLNFYRTLYYLPAIVPAVAVFILWLWILEPSRGLMNQFLGGLGVQKPPYWLQDPAWAKPSLIVMGLWGVGASMVIWLAGLKDIPTTLYEAASIDGANRIQRFFRITLPLLSPYIFFNMVMGLIGVFQIFEQAFVMTDGGPADSTLFYAYKLFNEAFRYLNMGGASAMAWLLFIVVLVITLFQLWLGKKWVHYGG